MIRHDFLSNSISRKLNFTFDPQKDEADEEDFLKFLHYLSGCREKSCVRVMDAKSCVALLHVSTFNLFIFRESFRTGVFLVPKSNSGQEHLENIFTNTAYEFLNMSNWRFSFFIGNFFVLAILI